MILLKILQERKTKRKIILNKLKYGCILYGRTKCFAKEEKEKIILIRQNEDLN
jgi:hypothetical protein